MATVKSRRPYRSPVRAEKAEQTRKAILDAAKQLFLTSGYVPTTIAGIAERAGVAVDTVYKSFGGKPGLVRAIYERGLAGTGPTPAYERSDEMRERETDPRKIMRKWGHLTAEVAAEVTPIRLLMRSAAAVDSDIAEILDTSNQERLVRMRHHARFLAARGYLRDGVSVAHAADILWTCSSAELYELFVMQRGWSSKRFARFVSDLMIHSLLET